MILNAIKIGKNFVRGQVSLQQKNYQEAFESFGKCYTALGEKKARRDEFFDLDIMMSECAFALDKRELAIAKLQEAKTKIDRSNKFSDVDRSYLDLFCELLLFDYGERNNLNADAVLDFPYDKASKKLKLNFPIDRENFIADGRQSGILGTQY